MLNAYRDTDGSFARAPSGEVPPDVVWIDLFDPTDEERRTVENRTGLKLPTRED